MKTKIYFSCCFAMMIVLTVISYGQPAANSKTVYIHTDRAYYAPGESLFFKAYILENREHASNQIFDTLYIALMDHDGVEVTNGAFPLGNSLFSANIDLPLFLTEGSYMLIASTSAVNNFSAADMFSKIIEIRNPEESDLSVDLSLTDSIYNPGSLLTAYVRMTGVNNSVSFNYQVTGSNGELLNGKGKTNAEGTTILKLQLPDFDSHQTLKLLITPLNKGTKKIAGIVIPTHPEEHADIPDSPADGNNHLNIQVRTLKQVYVPGDKVQLAISVTDEKGQPVMANLSVSASNLIPLQFPLDYNNIIEYINYKSINQALNSDLTEPESEPADNPTNALFNYEIRNYFTQSLNRFIQSPGRTFIVQEKNNVKKLRKKQETVLRKSGYSSDFNIMDIIMQIKPYHLENGQIYFGMNAIGSIYNQNGSLIVVDGIRMGTDASVLSTIPVQDIAHIAISTNLMDIQRYSAMNNTGIIEITMKKSNVFDKNEDISKGNTLYWEPDLIIDNTGKKSIDFLNNDNSKEVIISVNGINGKGVYGSTTLRYSVSH